MYELEQAAVHLPAKGVSNEKEFLILTHSNFKEKTLPGAFGSSFGDPCKHKKVGIYKNKKGQTERSN